MTDEKIHTWSDWFRGARRSLTVWFSTAMIVLPPAIGLLQENFATLAPFIPPALHSQTVQVLGLISLILRFRTSVALPHR